MNKIWLVMRQELLTLVTRFSFWFSVLGLPLLGFLIAGGATLINQGHDLGLGETGAAALAGVEEMLSPSVSIAPQGYVDNAHLIHKFPRGFNPTQLVGYDSISAAQEALDAGNITAFIIIPPDYIENGELYATTSADTRPRSSDLVALIDFNLLQGNQALAHAVEHPLAHLQEIDLAIQHPSGHVTNSGLGFILSYGVMMIYFIAIMGSASLMLNSITKEKENRILEVLMVSVTPHELLIGKIAALGLVGLLQVAIWGGSSLVILRMSGQAFELPQELTLSPSLPAWGLAFFLLGFLVYASLMAGLGALVPNLREASQATFLVMLPLTVPLFIITALIDRPNGAPALIFSLFPLTSPTVMMLRMTLTPVPIWQLLLALLLLGVAALLVIRVVARMFRAQTLLSGQPFQLKQFFRALAGKG